MAVLQVDLKMSSFLRRIRKRTKMNLKIAFSVLCIVALTMIVASILNNGFIYNNNSIIQPAARNLLDIIGTRHLAANDEKDADSPVITDESYAFDDSLAISLSRRVRVACFITTMEKQLDTKVQAVNMTWGKRCDKMVYLMTSNKTAPDIYGVKIVDSHGTLTEKIVAGFTHMREKYFDGYDWFLKADDDTYFIIENLKYLLSHFDPKEPVVVGNHYKHFAPNGYMGGGAGYVLSREALRRLVDDGYAVPGKCRLAGGSEDIETGRCLEKMGVIKYVSLDRYNRSTFHGVQPENYVTSKTNFEYEYRVEKHAQGLDCCSQLLISFHYIRDPKSMYVLDMLLYRVSVYGRRPLFNRVADLFKVRKSIIPEAMRRMIYPGETKDLYYANFTEWKRKNMTIYTKAKKKS